MFLSCFIWVITSFKLVVSLSHLQIQIKVIKKPCHSQVMPHILTHPWSYLLASYDNVLANLTERGKYSVGKKNYTWEWMAGEKNNQLQNVWSKLMMLQKGELCVVAIRITLFCTEPKWTLHSPYSMQMWIMNMANIFLYQSYEWYTTMEYNYVCVLV